MGLTIYTSLSYIRYLLNSGNRHSVHSPFVYNLIDRVFRNKLVHSDLRMVDHFRDRIIKNQQIIEIEEFSGNNDLSQVKCKPATLALIVKKSSVSKKYGKLLFNLVKYFKPEVVIEIGTSVGISTLYLSKADVNARILTLEGCKAKSGQASLNFEAMQCSNIERFTGKFHDILPLVIQNAGKLDFAFVDGDHSCDATLANFEALLSISHNDTVFVFDDIHWSRDMNFAWQQIADHERVTVSIDLFRMGIVFLRKELSKQKFVIRY